MELTSLTAIDGESNSKPETDLEKDAKQEKLDVDEKVREQNLSERVASFFRFSRKDSSNQLNDNVELGLNTSKSSTNGKSNGLKDAVDAREEKGDVEKSQTEVETSSHETPIRFSKFLNLFKRPNQKTMEPMDEDDNEVEDNDEKTDEDQEKQGKENIEFEPDTKPTDDEPLNPELTPSKSIELEEGEKSPPLSSSPKNTAV